MRDALNPLATLSGREERPARLRSAVGAAAGARPGFRDSSSIVL